MKKFDFTAQDLEAMSKEQEEKLKQAFKAPKDATADYTVRRKVIYRGKMAPPGCVYIVVQKKGKENTYEAHHIIEGGQGEVYEGMIEQQLRELIRTKYNV